MQTCHLDGAAYFLYYEALFVLRGGMTDEEIKSFIFAAPNTKC